MNISSVIVIPHPDFVQTTRAALATLPGVEVHALSPEGKMILTIEAETDADTTRAFEVISQQDGVLSASMVYHQNEPNPETVISVEA